MSRVTLSTPLQLPGRVLREIDLREPGRQVVAAMAAVRLPAGFTDAQATRFAARLSGVSELALGRLAPADLANVKAELETLYASGRRRDAARRAIAEGEA